MPSTHDDARLLRAVLESGLEASLVVSPDGRMVSYNERFVQLWPIPDDVVASGSDEAALSSVLDKLTDPDGFLERVRACYADPVRPARDELLLTDGRVFDRYGTPLRDADGAYLGWAWYFRDVTSERIAAAEAREAGERFASLARTLQESLLPPHLPDVPGLEVAARYLPAGTGVEVVGDFYDVFQTGESTWAVVIGDVCGNGVEAAKVTALARYTIRAAAIGDRAPAHVLRLLNQAVLRQHPDSERFITATYLSLAQRHGAVRGVLSCAGHPPALLRTADGRVAPVGVGGMILGAFEEVALTDTRFELRPGDVLVLYTDGVLEARPAGGEDLYGEERLVDLLAGLGGRSAAAVAEAVERDVVAFRGDRPGDDTAVLVVRVPDGPAACPAGRDVR